MNGPQEMTLVQTLARARGTVTALQGATGFARVHLVAQLLADLNRLERDGAFDQLAGLLAEAAAFAQTVQMAQLAAHLAEGAE